MSATYDLADRYVARAAALDPVAATFRGLTGHDGEMTDYSPDGFAERTELARTTIRELDETPPETDADRLAADVMRHDLELAIDRAEAGESFRLLRVLGSPVQSVRQCFDLLPTDTEADWATIAARLALVPQGLSGIQATLTDGIDQSLVSARRQVVACTRQAETWAGIDTAGTRPFFAGLVDRFDESGIDAPALRTTLAERAERATAAYAAFARYLAADYSPHADAPDAVGIDRYSLWSRSFNGIDLDLAETYAWGWDELYRIEHAMAEVGERVLAGRPLPEVIEHLETDPHRRIDGVDEFRGWLQDLMEATIAELDGVHFDIPEPVKRVEAMIAPPGGAAAMYYTGPSEDFSRPGRTWYPTLGKTSFALWGEVSICYHEGVPGHHLQIAQVRYLADRLSRYQRTLAGSAGHAEGWALYAERLMGELGYLDDPAYELGMLRAQAMRAVRVVVDIGMHLELAIPEREPYHGGETWTPELALPFVIERSWFPEDFMASEVDRYLGMPAQAISYKVGERVWLGARAAAKARAGGDFDLKAFHRRALDLGPMGLGQLERELAAF
ncbi:MAG TPA: DUF885 domain-containing protein [Acidimicrobiia bacterium]|nr:DUF885 domain-containing protein [Acidimicrobiia bacterium]